MRALLEHGRSVFRLRLSLSLLVRRGPSLMVRGGPKSHALLACHNRRRMIRASCVHSIGYGFPRCRILSGLFFRVSGPMPDMYPHDPAKFLRRGQGDSAPSAQASSFRHRLQRDQVPVEVLLRIAGMLTRLPAKISQPVDGGPRQWPSCGISVLQRAASRKTCGTDSWSVAAEKTAFFSAAHHFIVSFHLLPLLRLHESAGRYFRSALSWLSGLKRVLHVFKSSASCRGSVRSGDSCAGRRVRLRPCV